jgi:hypothetical protein
MSRTPVHPITIMGYTQFSCSCPAQHEHDSCVYPRARPFPHAVNPLLRAAETYERRSPHALPPLWAHRPCCPSQPRSAAPSLGGGMSRLAPLALPACPCHARCRCPSPPTWSQVRLLSSQVWPNRGCFSRRMQPTSGACTMPRLSQACLLGSTPSPQQALQGDAAHQAQRRTWLTPKDSPGTW